MVDKKRIICACGKRLAMRDGDIIYLWCKSCKREEAYRIKINMDGSIDFVNLRGRCR